MANIFDIPTEILTVVIFQHLSTLDIIHFCTSNSKHLSICYDKYLWEKRLKDFWKLSPIMINRGNSVELVWYLETGARIVPILYNCNSFSNMLVFSKTANENLLKSLHTFLILNSVVIFGSDTKDFFQTLMYTFSNDQYSESYHYPISKKKYYGTVEFSEINITDLYFFSPRKNINIFEKRI